MREWCSPYAHVADVPAYIGIGIATPEQAKEAARASDGVIVGSALVQIILDGGDASRYRSLHRRLSCGDRLVAVVFYTPCIYTMPTTDGDALLSQYMSGIHHARDIVNLFTKLRSIPSRTGRVDWV